MDRLISDFAKNLELGTKALQMYSEAHPSAKRVVQDAYQSMLRLLEKKDNITLSITNGNLVIEGELMEKGNLMVDRLSRDLFDRNIQSLTLTRGISQEDLIFFLKQLNVRPQRLRELGGFEKIIQEHGIQTIQINRVKYAMVGDTIPAGLDQGTFSELLIALQALTPGANNEQVAQNVEKSLAADQSNDPGATLLRIFHMIAQRAPEIPENLQSDSMKEKILSLYRSFSPAMQTKLLLSAVLREAPETALLYRQLTPEELESTVLRMLDDPSAQGHLNEFVARLQRDDQVVFSEKLKQKIQEKLQHGSAVSVPSSITQELMKKDSWTPADIERIPELLLELIHKGNLTEADQISKRVFAFLGGGQSAQKKAAIESLPKIISVLSANEKWKNVEFSLSFLISTCYKKESSQEVLPYYIPLLLSIFQKNYEAKNWAGCQDILGTVRVQLDRHENVRQEFTDQWIRMSPIFIEHLREAGTGVETIVDGFKTSGSKGLSYLIELLADEEDQKVRSRLINYIVSFKPELVLSEIENRMSDTRWFVVRNMVTIVSKMNLPELPEFMKKAALHADPRVSRELLKILYRGPAKSHNALTLTLLDHPDKSIRTQAVHLVTMQSIPGAVPQLIKLASTGSAGDTDLRVAALQALLKLRSLDAVSVAAEILERKSNSKAEVAERNAAVRVLGELAREQARELLQRIAQSDPFPETRTVAAAYI